MLPTITLNTNTGDIYDHYIVNSGTWRYVKGVKGFRFHLVWCRHVLENSLVLKKNLNKYVITIWPSNGPLDIYLRKMTFYTPTKTCREAGCASPKLKITEMSNSEQMMEPGCVQTIKHIQRQRGTMGTWTTWMALKGPMRSESGSQNTVHSASQPETAFRWEKQGCGEEISGGRQTGTARVRATP